MSKKTYSQGAAYSFHTNYLRENMIGQDFKGSKVTNVTNKYIVTEDGNYAKKGLSISFEVTKPNARGFGVNRREG